MRCELCGKEAELRPYGPKGELICFECGLKDEATTTKNFLMQLNSCGNTPMIGLECGPIPLNMDIKQ